MRSSRRCAGAQSHESSALLVKGGGIAGRGWNHPRPGRTAGCSVTGTPLRRHSATHRNCCWGLNPSPSARSAARSLPISGCCSLRRWNHPAGQSGIAPGEGFRPSQHLNIGKRPYASGDDGSNDSLEVQVLADWTAMAVDFVDIFSGDALTTVTFYGNSSNVICSTTDQNRKLTFLGVISEEPIQHVFIDEPGDDGMTSVTTTSCWPARHHWASSGPSLAISRLTGGVLLRWSVLFGDYCFGSCRISVRQRLVAGARSAHFRKRRIQPPPSLRH